MSEFTAKKLKEARMKAEITQDEAAALMNVTRRAISEMEAGKRSISADEFAQCSRIYNVDVRELLFVEFTEAGDEQRLTAKYSSFLKLLKKLSDRKVEDVYWVIKRKVEGLFYKLNNLLDGPVRVKAYRFSYVRILNSVKDVKQIKHSYLLMTQIC